MQIPRIDPKNAAGLVDKVVGLGKEIIGTVTNRDNLTKAGQVQQDKGTERLKAVKAQMEAESHKAKAAGAESAQKSAQKTKEAVH
jgi:microcystin-dependent protein